MKQSARKFLSVLLSVVMVLSVFAIVPFTASAAENAPEWTQRDDGKVYFYADPSLWRNYQVITMYLYVPNDREIITWGSKKGRMTDEGNNIWSYDLDAKGITLDSDKQYGLIFTADWGLQTCDLIFGTECLGDMAYMSKDLVENSVDPNKKSYIVEWGNADRTVYAPPVCITSIGNVIGEAFWADETPYDMFCRFLSSHDMLSIFNAVKWNGKTLEQTADDTARALGLTEDDQQQAYEETDFDPNSSEPEPYPYPDDCEHLNTEFVPAQEATCGDYGWTEGIICTDCYQIISGREDIPPTGDHDWSYEIIPVDCGHTGMTHFVCSMCGEEYDYHIIEKTGDHHFEDGFCTVCGLPDVNTLEDLPLEDGKIIDLKVVDNEFYRYTPAESGALEIEREDTEVAIRVYDADFNVLCELYDDFGYLDFTDMEAGETYIVELWQQYGDTLNAEFRYSVYDVPPTPIEPPAWEKRDDGKVYFYADPEIWTDFNKITVFISSMEDEFFEWGSNSWNMTDEGDGIWSYDLAAHGIALDSDMWYDCSFTADWGNQTFGLPLTEEYIGDLAFMTGVFEGAYTDDDNKIYESYWAIGMDVPYFDDDKTVPLKYIVDYLDNNYGDDEMNSVEAIEQLLTDLDLTPDEVIDSILEQDFDEKEENDLIDLLLQCFADDTLVGDVDGDGEVTVKDVTMLQRHLADFTNIDGTPILDESDEDVVRIADADGDGEITVKDVSFLQRAIADFDVDI